MVVSAARGHLLTVGLPKEAVSCGSEFKRDKEELME